MQLSAADARRKSNNVNEPLVTMHYAIVILKWLVSGLHGPLWSFKSRICNYSEILTINST